MKNILTIIAICTLSFSGAFAQQDPLLSHYMFNGLFINPAYAGSHPYTGATLVHRNQWMGYKGGGQPTTTIFGLDGPIKKKTMGLGLTFVNDNTGGFSRNDILINYAYQLKVNDMGTLSLGVNAGLVNLGYDNSNTLGYNHGSELTKIDDVAFTNGGFWTPKIGFGAYYYTKKFYAGVSLPTLYAKEGKGFSYNLSPNNANYFKTIALITAGYVFDIGKDIMLKPSTLIKYQKNAPLQVDLNCNAFLRNGLSAGLSFRTDKTSSWLVALLGYNINPEMRLGLGYDFNFSGIRKYQKGSLEIMLGYDFGSRTMKVKNPRYF
jgi:type IX secretion system PorP/SprF family membrane protein